MVPDPSPVPNGVRAVGVGAAILGGLHVAMYVMNTSVRESGGRDLTPLLYLGGVFMVLGAGMLLRSRLAALLLSAPLAACAVLIVGGCILARDWWALLLNSLLAVPWLMAPALVTWAEWGRLRWLGGGSSNA